MSSLEKPSFYVGVDLSLEVEAEVKTQPGKEAEAEAEQKDVNEVLKEVKNRAEPIQKAQAEAELGPEPAVQCNTQVELPPEHSHLTKLDATPQPQPTPASESGQEPEPEPEPEPGPNTVFVGGIPGHVPPHEFRNFMAKFGTIVAFKLVLREGSHLAFAFVQYENRWQAEDVKKNHILHFKGRKLNVGDARRKATVGDTPAPEPAPQVAESGSRSAKTETRQPAGAGSEQQSSRDVSATLDPNRGRNTTARDETGLDVVADFEAAVKSHVEFVTSPHDGDDMHDDAAPDTHKANQSAGRGVGQGAAVGQTRASRPGKHPQEKPKPAWLQQVLDNANTSCSTSLQQTSHETVDTGEEEEEMEEQEEDEEEEEEGMDEEQEEEQGGIHEGRTVEHSAHLSDGSTPKRRRTDPTPVMPSQGACSANVTDAQQLSWTAGSSSSPVGTDALDANAAQLAMAWYHTGYWTGYYAAKQRQKG